MAGGRSFSSSPPLIDRTAFFYIQRPSIRRSSIEPRVPRIYPFVLFLFFVTAHSTRLSSSPREKERKKKKGAFSRRNDKLKINRRSIGTAFEAQLRIESSKNKKKKKKKRKEINSNAYADGRREMSLRHDESAWFH